MRSSTAQTAFLCAVGAARVRAVLEVIFDLVEALFGDEIFAFGAEVAAVDNGVDKLVRVGAQITATLDATDAFEAEGIPNAAGGNVGFIDEVEYGVSVALGCTSVLPLPIHLK